MVMGERQRVADPSEQLEPFRLAKVVEVGVEGPVAVDEQGPSDGAGSGGRRSVPCHQPAEPRDGIRVHP
jgi:hypothetical protein